MKKLFFTSNIVLKFILAGWAFFLAADQLAPLSVPFLQQQQDQFARLIVARDGTPLRAFADQQGVWRYPVTIAEVSPVYIDTLLAYEDRWFWYHPGINPLAILRAASQNVFNRRIISGGSTLTMQVARILDPHSRTIPGKLKQMFRALQLEWHYSKAQILTLYLNLAPFGGPIEGVQAASFAYLSKPVKELSLAEAALLSVLPQSPSRFRPDRHPLRATNARNKVLERLHRFDYIRRDEMEDAKLEVVVPQLEARPMLAPILAQRLKKRVQYGKILETTIDANLQETLESLVKDYTRQLPAKSSAAALVVNHHDMTVTAYVASADFFDSERYGQVDMIRAVRSPGSTLKPFLYAMALDQGLISSHSMLMDKAMNAAGYKPENFSNNFSGAVSMSDALQRSLNIPAIQVLQFLGPGYFHARLENAGLKLRLPAGGKPNLSMVLGGAGTQLEELVSAYTAFSRSGKAGQLRFTADSLLEEKYLISPGSAWIIRDILSKIQDRHALSGMISQGNGIRLAYKTGTSYGFRDAWAIGMTADYTIGIWTGRPDGTPVPGHYGAQTAVPLLQAVTQNLPAVSGVMPNVISKRQSLKASPFLRPDSVTQQVICWPDGRLLEQTDPERCRKTQLSWILDHTIPPVLAVNPELETVLNELKIVSIDNGAHIKLPAGSTEPLSINLEAQGGRGGILWFIDGKPLNKQATRAVLNYTFTKAGKYQIMTIDRTGQTDQVTLYVSLFM